ncbi:MAG: beta-propeller fold lactonase family protein [Armatimonadetes bacterium]|nr:beta-propeller fold lactonase family protein [Armatimonadota bacterium]
MKTKFLLGALAAVLLGLAVGCTTGGGGGTDATVAAQGAGGPVSTTNLFQFLYVAERSTARLRSFETRIGRDANGNPAPNGTINAAENTSTPQDTRVASLNFFSRGSGQPGANWVAFHPNGKLAFLISRGDSDTNVDPFTSNAAGGQVTILAVEPTSGQFIGAPANFTEIGVDGTDGAFAALVHPSGNFLYVVGDVGVRTFTINSNTGQIQQAFADVGGPGLRIPIFSRNGNFMYVTNTFTGAIDRFAINADNSVTQLASVVPPGGAGRPMGITLDTTGGFLYVANQGAFNAAAVHTPGNISGFTVAANGNLAPLAGFPVTNPGAGLITAGIAALEVPTGLAVDANNHLYVADQGTTPLGVQGTNSVKGFIAGFQIGAGGGLTPLPNSPYNGPLLMDNPVNLITDNFQRFLYVAGSADLDQFDEPDETGIGSLTVWQIFPDGSLDPIQATTSDSPFGLAMQIITGSPKLYLPVPGGGDPASTPVDDPGDSDSFQPGLLAVVLSPLGPLVVSDAEPPAVSFVPPAPFPPFSVQVFMDDGQVFNAPILQNPPGTPPSFPAATISVAGVAGAAPLITFFNLGDPAGLGRVGDLTPPAVTAQNTVTATVTGQTLLTSNPVTVTINE